MNQRTLRALGGIATCAVLAPAAPAQYTRPIALAGQPANGLPAGLNYQMFFPNGQRNLVLNANDQVLTMVYALDPANTNRAELALYSGASATAFQPVARWGADFPGLPGVSPKMFGQFNISHAGLLVTSADLQGPATTPADDVGFFIGTSASNLTLLGRQGGTVPGVAAGVTASGFVFPVMNRTGLLAVGLTLGGATNNANNSGIFLRRPGAAQLEKFIYESDPTPDVPGQVFGQATLSRLNDAGDFLALTGLAGAGATGNENVIWSGTSAASLKRVAQTVTQAPGLAAGIQYGSFSSTSLTQNRAGRYAFQATLSSATPGQVTTANDSAVFVGDRGQAPTLFAREGDRAPIPGATNVAYTGVLNAALGGSGLVAFTAKLTNRPFNADAGLFAGTTPANVAALALAGQRPPTTPAGSAFQAAFSNVSVNAADQVAFLAGLLYAGSSRYESGLFVHDPVQGLICLARTGGTIDVDGVMKTITSLEVSQGGNGEDGQASPFNDRGTLVFTASGADFSGIFTARVPIIGDVNSDGRVSFTDFQILERGFGSTNAERSQGDLNGDRTVDDVDFRLLYRNLWTTADDPPPTPAQWQAVAEFASTVPEPSAVGAALLAGCGLAAGPRRRRGPK